MLVVSHGTKACDFPQVPQIVGVFVGQKHPDPLRRLFTAALRASQSVSVA